MRALDPPTGGKETQGKANPGVVKELLEKKLVA